MEVEGAADSCYGLLLQKIFSGILLDDISVVLWKDGLQAFHNSSLVKK